jgi:uncharacterized protein YbcC (UPF0753/DUF2309 family)
MNQGLARTLVKAHEPALDHGKEREVRHERDLQAVLSNARKRVAPLWPLESFVAVNPFLGLSDERFESACQTLGRVAGISMLLPREQYRAWIAEGRITSKDLDEALSHSRAVDGAPQSLDALHAALADTPSYESAVFQTVADVCSGGAEGESNRRVLEDISKWCAAYWDDGQSAWQMPWRHLPLYQAWRATVAIDRTADLSGLRGFRGVITTLPEDPSATIECVIDELGLSEAALDGYLHRALVSIGGWAAYARYLGWKSELEGEEDGTVTELLAIRLAWDYALFMLGTEENRAAWKAALGAMDEASTAPAADQDRVIDAILQGAFEAVYRRGLIAKLKANSDAPRAGGRMAVQAAFCIDVRSEVYRRALESVAPRAQTIGFAGFFGFPIEYVSIGQSSGPAQCPVLLNPKFVVKEGIAGADEDESTEILGLRLLRRRASKAWKSFKSSAVSSFVYVETAGLAFAGKLIGDATGLTRPVTHPSADGLDEEVLKRTLPVVEEGSLGVRKTGIPQADRVALAEGALRGMSLTKDFARLVLLTGHGSTMVNNAHAAGYDCGACGGHPGDANARIAAEVLNDPEVRSALRFRGIAIPEDTWFVGCLHDTTADDITIFDRDSIPESHTGDVEQAESWLAEASRLARRERAATLNVGARDVDKSIARRTRDWSQVRPEWGLARNAAFIAARRARTRGVDLEGRAFLHDYDWTADEGWKVLELIMTAPMVVASWINLQYYGSAVNREAFGSGNKTLHNVVGTLGVLEGNGGDLRVGLPSQAVHDGSQLFHEPVRLNVLIEAPTVQIDAILGKHDNVRELVDNGWIHLLAIGEEGQVQLRDASEGHWITVG